MIWDKSYSRILESKELIYKKRIKAVPRKNLKLILMLIFFLLGGTILYFLIKPPGKRIAGNALSESETDEYRIGVSLGKSGEYAEPAMMQEKGYRLWEKIINEKGGLFGKKVVMVIMDDESNVEKAVQIYRSFVGEMQVDLVFGPYSSDITKAVIPIVDELGYPMLLPGAADDNIWEQEYKNIIGLLTPASRYAEGILKLALLEGLKKVAIVHAGDAFSIQVAEGALKRSHQLDLDMVMVEGFKKGTKDLTPLAQKAKDASAELLIVGGHFNESINMRRALNRIGWYPKAFFATIGPAFKKYQELLGSEAEFTFATSLWEPHKIYFPGSKAFAATFKNRYGHDPSYQAADAFAAGQILEAAVELAGGLDRGRIRQALYDLDTYTIIGRYSIDRTGRQVKRFPLTIQWQEGKKEIVWPEKVRTKNPIFKRGN